MQKSNSNSSTLHNTVVVYMDHGTCNLTTYNHFQSIPQTSWNQREISTLSKTSDVGSINLEPVLSTTSVLSDAQAIISAAWKNTTKSKYDCTFKRWANFSNKKSIDSLQPHTVNKTEFLTEEALGHCIPCDIINHSTVSTFLKGVYNLRSLTPKYFTIWGVNTLLFHTQH